RAKPSARGGRSTRHSFQAVLLDQSADARHGGEEADLLSRLEIEPPGAGADDRPVGAEQATTGPAVFRRPGRDDERPRTASFADLDHRRSLDGGLPAGQVESAIDAD